MRVYGTLGHDLGKAKLELEWAGNTLADLIRQMANKYGVKVIEELLDETGNLDCAYGVFSAGERVTNLAARIDDGTEVVIVNMLAGGRFGGPRGPYYLRSPEPGISHE